MIGAIVRNDLVENLIVIDEKNIEEMAAALQCEIIDAAPYGLQVGDLRTAAGWTRNAGGEQMVLQPVEQENYETYELQQKQITELQEQVAAASKAADEAAEGAVAETMSVLGLE